MKSSSNSTSPSDPGIGGQGPNPAGWAALLELEIARGPLHSTIVARRHMGPLVVQRPFHPERDGTCHVLLVHPPGGLVSGDSLSLRAALHAKAQALFTTPAATKLYRARHGAGAARQHVVFSLEADAELEYFPQETIAFEGTRARLVTEVELAAGARFLGWEIACLGRPAAGERFARGELELCIRVRRAGRPLLLERLALRAGSAVPDSPAGLRGEPVVGTFVLATGHACSDGPASEQAIALADEGRAALAELSLRGLAAVTSRGELVLVRYLGPSAEEARQAFEQVWRALRPRVLGKAAVPPRIWQT